MSDNSVVKLALCLSNEGRRSSLLNNVELEAMSLVLRRRGGSAESFAVKVET